MKMQILKLGKGLWFDFSLVLAVLQNFIASEAFSR